MKILVLTAHPNLETSKINRIWFGALKQLPNLTGRDLASVGGSELRFDASLEQQILLAHDRIVFQFPFYWYSSPPVLKAWMDQVLSYGFAYGPGGDKLKGREFLVVVSTGGPADSYHAGGYNNHSMDEYLKPFQQTATLSGMTYLRPFVFHGMAIADGQKITDSVPAMIKHVCDPELDPKIRQARLLKELETDREKAAAVS